MTAWRRSNVQRYLECPFLYYAIEDGVVEALTSDPANVGIAFAEIAAEYRRHLKAAGRDKDWDWIKKFGRDTSPARYRDEVCVFLEQLKHEPQPVEQMVLIDELVEVQATRRIRIRLQPDYLLQTSDMTAEVHDDKTGWVTWTDNKLATHFQARWNTYAAWKWLHGKPEFITFVMHYRRMGGRTAQWTFGVEDFWAFEGLLKNTVAEIDERKYDQPWGYNPNCVSCPLKVRCPKLAQLSIIPETFDEACRVAEGLAVEAEVSRELRQHLRDWHETTGVALPAGSGKEWRTVSPRGRKVTDAPALLDALDEAMPGELWLDSMVTGMSALKKHIKRVSKVDAVAAAECSEAVERFSKPSGSAQFRLAKAQTDTEDEDECQ